MKPLRILILLAGLSGALSAAETPTANVPLRAGATLESALAALNAHGYRIVYSNALVQPSMTLREAPRSTRIDELLREILAPWKLRAVQASNGDWLIAADDTASTTPGDIVDDNDLPGMGDAMLGVVTACVYSVVHNSPANKEYVAAFKKANNFRPNFISLGGYDGMHLIYEALKKTQGKTDGEALINAMKGMKWESPRGPISIDPQTRDIVQNIYIGKVEKVQGELYNVEFATFDAVKDPLKMKK